MVVPGEGGVDGAGEPDEPVGVAGGTAPLPLSAFGVMGGVGVAVGVAAGFVLLSTVFTFGLTDMAVSLPLVSLMSLFFVEGGVLGVAVPEGRMLAPGIGSNAGTAICGDTLTVVSPIVEGTPSGFDTAVTGAAGTEGPIGRYVALADAGLGKTGGTGNVGGSDG